jgi:hypothetical protein
LNLAVPVAAVLSDGDTEWPERLAMKVDCCANAGIDIAISDRTRVLMDTIEVYLPMGNFIDCFHFHKHSFLK